jgi:peptidoglycan/xylan/chitin deacetylase (PgdA/CDA1 family)
LLILCYHGVSQVDEHDGCPELYMPADLFRRRMASLREGGYEVLSLPEGVSRLNAGTLPPRAVAITFDDGFVDFSRIAYPILREFGYPATVYVSTQYVQKQFPVFPPILAYILWRARGREADGRGFVSDGLPLKTATALDRSETFRRLVAAVGSSEGAAMTDPVNRDAHAAGLAERLGVDYDEIKRRRLFHLMTELELAELEDALVDVQLHTHKHLQPRDRQQFAREIAENRRVLESAGIPEARLRHYCYPNGEVRPELTGWLRELQVRSATTCVPGIAGNDSESLLLPRFVDTQDVTPLKFEAWLCGAAALLPQRG